MTGITAYPRLRQAEKAIGEGRLETASAIVIQHLRENRNEPRGFALLGSIAFKLFEYALTRTSGGRVHDHPGVWHRREDIRPQLQRLPAR